MNNHDAAIARLKAAIRAAEEDVLHPERFMRNGARLAIRPDGSVVVPSLLGRRADCEPMAPLAIEDRSSAHLSVLLAVTEMRNEILKRILADKEAIAAAKDSHLSAYTSDEAGA